MKSASFKKLLGQVPGLDHSQRVKLREQLDHSGDLTLVCDLIEKRIEDNPFCPHCQSGNFTKHGFRNNLARYKCKSCGKTFNALTGTPLAHLKCKEKWLGYAQCLLESKSIRSSLAEVNVAITTSFRWRHRMLTLAQSTESQLLGGIVEVDEAFLRESQKGNKHLSRPPRKRGEPAGKWDVPKEQVAILVALDRNENEADYLTGFGAVSSSWLQENFAKHLASESILVHDSAKSFESFCRKEKIPHIAVDTWHGIRRRGIFHIQHANTYLLTFKSWMQRFNGVATKYLGHYLGWCNELYSRKISDPASLLQLAF